MCLSAITWSGFDNFYYLFSYEDTRDEFEIPHDLNIMEAVFLCRDGAYAETNTFWTSHYLGDLIAQGTESERANWEAQVASLRSAYDVLSDRYQAVKGESEIPLA
jgi:hypothetical protein